MSVDAAERADADGDASLGDGQRHRVAGRAVGRAAGGEQEQQEERAGEQIAFHDKQRLDRVKDAWRNK